MRMLKLEERPSKAKDQKPAGHFTKAKRFRIFAKGYKVLRKDKPRAYEAAAEALEQMEQRSDQFVR